MCCNVDVLYSQHPLIRTLKEPNDMFELTNVQIIESCHKNSSRPSEWKESKKKCLFAFCQAQMKT